jgi:carbon storage regulator
MLVLSRRPGEALRFGDEIEITVVEVKGDMVRLGIDAPRTVQVWRKELWEVIVAENRKAAEETATTPEIPLSPAKGGVSDLIATKKSVSGLMAKKKKNPQDETDKDHKPDKPDKD